MKKLILLTTLVTIYSGCDLIDGTNVVNPNLTLDAAAAQENSATAWVNGLAQRNAVVYNSFLVTAELTTDNYQNKATFYNQNVDVGTFRDIDNDFNTAQRNIAQLREQAEYGLEIVLANDVSSAGTALEAEMHFYKGWSHLMAAETFVALPGDGGGVPLTPEEHFQLAIESFTNANNTVADVSYDLALARAHYGLGNQSQAVSFAQAVITADPDYVRYIQYDGVNGPTSTIESAVYDRQSFNDLQPLPRLDFLDPKYGDLGGTNESPVAMMKVEEAHLIIAEAQIADGTLPLAQTTMQNILALVNTRPTRVIDESEEGRAGTVNAGADIRPDTSAYSVRASASDAFIDSLVLDRTATTTIPTLSGTSVKVADILAVTNANEADRKSVV